MKIAHVRKDEDTAVVQDLKEHLNHVAELCRDYMEEIGCPSMGYIVGIMHDAGKAGAVFQRRMEAILAGEKDPGQKGGHASAGAVILNKVAGDMKKTSCQFAIQAMCEAIFSHHAALPDNISPEGEDGYLSRLQWEGEEALEEIERYFFQEIIEREVLEKLIGQAYEEAETLWNKIGRNAAGRDEAHYFVGLFEKMLLSALVDADWLDSAISGEVQEAREQILCKEQECKEERERIFKEFLKQLEDNVKGMADTETEINHWRSYISEKCGEAGRRNSGIYTLSCPTGAGKTLAAMRYALTHCLEHHKKRIFYIIPYISIIDQNAKSIKRAVSRKGDRETAENYILELHSNVEAGKAGTEQGTGEGRISPEFFSQRMVEPVVLTTMVRFLNTFFAEGTRNLRPAHQFQNAILIFDEIQSLPIKQIGLFNGLINFLTSVCNCTCILCTATQPLLGEIEKPVYPAKLSKPSRLVELPAEAEKSFKRVQVQPKLKQCGYGLQDLTEFILKKASSNDNMLVIMNTKPSALSVYCGGVQKAADDFKVFYLSTGLYAAHRKKILEEIREALLLKEKIIVVSTQLIEAGIDFDFSCVVRSLAGMDSVVQAAGRCNREGKNKLGITYIVNPDKSVESLKCLKDIQEGANCTRRLLEEFQKDPEAFQSDLLSERAMHTYFKYYFWDRKGEMNYRIPKIIEYTLYNLLSLNKSLVVSGMKHNGYREKILNQSFRTAADHYKVIEETGNPVFVPREEGKRIWEEVQRSTDYGKLKTLLKKAQQYIVNVPQHELKKMGEGRGIVHWDEKMEMYVLNEMYYDEKTGLTGEISENMPCYRF